MNKLNPSTSPFMVTDQMEYLLLNGFDMQVVSVSLTVFTKDDVQLQVLNDTLILNRYHDGEDDRKPGYQEENRFNHVSNLDEVQFIFLLDVFGVVRMKEFIRRASEVDRKQAVEELIDALIPVT